MQSLVESPWPVLFAGVLIEAGLAVAILRTGKGKLIWLMLLAAALTAGGLAAERMIVTDREAITDTLKTACRAVENNDIERLLGCISPSAEGPRRMSHIVLDRFDVNKAVMQNLRIEINQLTSPPSADAHFKAIGRGKDRKGQIPYNAYAQQVVVKLEKRNDRWLVTGYSIEDVTPNQL